MADVDVKFGAQIDGLVAGINAVKANIESITGPVAAVKTALGGITEALSAAFAVEKITEFMDRFGELGESITRTAAITGLATQEVQLFTLAIKLSGGDAETASMTLNILQKNIGDAISQAGPARTAFENMGFSLAQLKNTDVVDLLFQIKTRMDEAGSSAEQSALKQDYLRTVAGRGAAGFLALGKSLEEVKRIAAETGVIMNPAMVSQANELAESTKKLSAAWTGLGNNIASLIEPAYDAMIGKTTTLMQNTNGLIGLMKMSSSRSTPSMGFFNALTGNDPALAAGGATGSWGPQGKDLGEGQFGPVPNKPLPPLDKSSGKDGADTRDQAARLSTDTQISLSHLAFEQISQDQNALVELSKESEAQKIQALIAASELQEQTEQGLLDKEAAGYAQDSLAYQQVQARKAVLTAQFNLEVSRLNDQLAASQKKQYEQQLGPWKQLTSDMGGAFDTMINGVLSGTQTWKQALGKSFDDLGIKFAEIMAKMTAEYLAFSATSGKGILGFGTTNPFSALSGGGQQAAQIANTAALTTLNAQMAALNVAMGTAVTATAANTASTDASAVQGIEATAENTVATLGNTIAVDALKLVEGVKTLLGFDVGTWGVSNTGAAVLHQGEIVLPPGISAGVRAGTVQVGSVGASSGGNSGGGGDAYTININAIDTQTGAQFLKQNAGIIASSLSNQARNFNKNMRT